MVVQWFRRRRKGATSTAEAEAIAQINNLLVYHHWSFPHSTPALEDNIATWALLSAVRAVRTLKDIKRVFAKVDEDLTAAEPVTERELTECFGPHWLSLLQRLEELEALSEHQAARLSIAFEVDKSFQTLFELEMRKYSSIRRPNKPIGNIAPLVRAFELVRTYSTIYNTQGSAAGEFNVFLKNMALSFLISGAGQRDSDPLVGLLDNPWRVAIELKPAAELPGTATAGNAH